MNELSLRRNTIVIIGLLVSVMVAMAQTDTGSIGGFVKDPTGGVIPKAKVTLKDEGTGAFHNLITDSSGYYIAPNLPPGLYTMSAEAAGFKRFESAHNRLAPNTALSLDADLAVGTETELVQVEATAAVLQTDSAAVQSEVGGAVVNMQELNGRNPLFEAQLLPGMRGTASMGDFNFAEGVTEPFYVNGTRQQDTLVTLDGAPANRTRANGQIIGVPNVDAIEEIQVLASDYAPEYGRASGGQIRVISKSGTKDFHGSLYEYFRNSDMNANTWTRNLSTLTGSTQAARYNNFGGTIGGPVWWPGLNDKWRERLFFFVAEDWIRYRYEDYTVDAVPTLDMRQGNFSELLSSNPWYSGSHVIYDPKTCPSLGAATCQPFPGNIIPSSRLSPNGIAIINAYPVPTPGFLNGTNNFIVQANHPINQRKGDMNFDIQLSPNNRLSARRSDLSYYELLPLDNNLGITPRIFNRPNQTNTVSLTTTITPTLLNEARITMSLDDVYIGVDTSAPGFNREDLPLPITYPYILPNGKDLPDKIPTISVPNFTGLAGGPYPSHSSGIIWTGGDNLTKVWNNHTFKFGVSFEYSGENDGDQINVDTVPGGASDQNGTFQFSDTRTGLGATSGIGMANLALGLADSYTEIGPRALTIWRGWMWEWYAQDSWKVTRKLHLDYGLRFSYIQGFHPLWGNADYFDGALYNPANAVQVSPATGNVILGTGNPYNGVVIPGYSSFPSAGGRIAAFTSNQCDGASCASLLSAPNLPQSYIQPTNTWQPRLGIAYELNSKTVVRAGIGAFATRMPLIDNIFPGGNSPFQPFIQVNNVSVDNPGAALTSGTAAALTMTTLNPNLKQPEAWNYNFTVQRELPIHTVLTVAYVGHHGDHAWQVYDINQAAAGALLQNPGVNINALRPYKGFGEIQEEESTGNSQYNGLQVQWERRFSAGSSFNVSYTYSKSMDNGSNYRDIVPDTYNTSNLWGPSEYDTRHVLLINWIYAFPFFKNNSQLQGKLLGGWSLAGTTQLQTGAPCGIGTNNDYAGVGEDGSFGCGSEGQFWVVNGPVTYNNGAFAGPVTNSSSPRYFTVSVSQPPSGTFNMQSVRDLVYQPGMQDWNLSLFKTFVVNERANFQFRAEAYDVINHPNLCAQYQSGCSVGGFLNPTSSQFGMVTSKSPLARNLQLSLRFAF